jgi:hypothetical protein
MDRQVDRAPVTPPTAQRRSRLFSIVRALLLTLVVAYALFGGTVALAMLQPPERFGRIMTHLPAPLVWGLLPAPRMWLWARAGRLQEGDPAPDFTLATFDHSQRVTLSSHRGDRPVVLVFGSYT